MDARDLPFLTALQTHEANAPALFDDNSAAWLTYDELRQRVDETAPQFACQTRRLVLCCLPRTIDGVVAYLAVAQAGHAIILADPNAPNGAAIIDTYQPDWIIAPQPSAHGLAIERRKGSTSPLHPDFYLMLLTSGSTGSCKGVRLSYGSIAANTHAIIKSIGLSVHENALCHLPLSYSFGLSVLHTQLAVGGRCLLTEASMMNSSFWQIARTQGATLFAGVPYHYEMMMKLGLARLKLPALTTFLQAGGKMQVPLTQKVLDEVQKIEGGKLFIMYGQTEASPRISCFALHEKPEKMGTSGPALDGIRLEVDSGEIIVHGPNVMMGYATTREDLAAGDKMNGCLATGDLGELDEDGYLTITGRAQRFAKLFGQRIALDDIEKIASRLISCIAIEHPEKIVILTTCDDPAILAQTKTELAAQTKLPAPWFELRTLPELPTKANGKVDYQALQQLAG